LLALFGLSLATVLAQSNTNDLVPEYGKVFRPVHHLSAKRLVSTNSSTDTFIIDYDKADSTAQFRDSAFDQGRFRWRMNSNLVTSLSPADSVAFRSAQRYVTVVFDSIYDSDNEIGYPSNAIQQLTIDTLIAFVGQENHSGTDDTLIMKIMSMTGDYPGTTVLAADTLIIPFNTPLSTSWANFFGIAFGFNYDLPAGQSKFAARLEYHGAYTDTCGFLASFSNNGFCSTSTTLENVSRTVFSPFNSIGYGINSYTFWNKYNVQSPKPDGTDAVWYNCGTTKQPTFFQNVDILAQVTVQNTLRVNEIESMGVKLYQNQPNPFQGNTQITYTLNTASAVNFIITDLLGRNVKSIDLGIVNEGKNTLLLNTETFSKGVYFYTLKAGEVSLTKKMVIAE
jgi:hypothetical protein